MFWAVSKTGANAQTADVSKTGANAQTADGYPTAAVISEVAYPPSATFQSIGS